MIFRDDDINKFTKLDDFKKVHEAFLKHGVIHTVALICNEIDKHPSLVEYLKEGIQNKSIDLQLHCFNHIKMTADYSECEKDLTLGLETMMAVFNIRPTVFYPPWNDADDKVKQIAGELGLITSNQKTSLSTYVRQNGNTNEKVINFHYWDKECMHLEAALDIYCKLKNRL